MVLYTVIFIMHRRGRSPAGARIALLVSTGLPALFARWLISGNGTLAVPVALYICAITRDGADGDLARVSNVFPCAGRGSCSSRQNSVLAITGFKTQVPMPGSWSGLRITWRNMRSRPAC